MHNPELYDADRTPIAGHSVSPVPRSRLDVLVFATTVVVLLAACLLLAGIGLAVLWQTLRWVMSWGR